MLWHRKPNMPLKLLWVMGGYNIDSNPTVMCCEIHLAKNKRNNIHNETKSHSTNHIFRSRNDRN